MKLFLYIIQALIITSWLTGYLGHYWWVFDLFSHFKVQYIIGSLIVVVASLYYHNFLLSFIATITLWTILATGQLIPDSTKKDFKTDPSARSLSIMSFNVWKQNRDYDTTLAHIRETSPDLVGLYETNEEWDVALKSLSDIYPHQIFYPGKGRFGMSILSKYPIVESDLPQNKGNSQRIIAGKVYTPFSETPLHVYAFHPYAPQAERDAVARNEQLQEMEAWVSENRNNPIVIMGDFNASPWSHPLKSILKKHKLIHTKPNKCGTWPSLLGEFGIPIDHILTKNVTANQNGHIGPHLGSDHRPVHAEIQL